MAGLIDKSLLLRAETSVATRPLYQMLETVRAFAALELAAAGERDDALEGLARYCTAEASLAAEGLVGPAQVEWLDRVRDDLESYRGALAWLIERGRPAEAADIAWGLMFFWVIRGHAAEGLRWYEQILTLPSLPPAAESRALARSGSDVVHARRTRARTHRAHARARARPRRRRHGVVAQTENMLGHVEHAAGNRRRGPRPVRPQRRGFRALAIPWGTGNALTGMAWVALATGDTGQAERLLDEATSELRHAGPWFLSLDAVCSRHPGGAAREPR